MPHEENTQLLEIGSRKILCEIEIDLVRFEGLRVLSQAQTLKPRSDARHPQPPVQNVPTLSALRSNKPS